MTSGSTCLWFKEKTKYTVTDASILHRANSPAVHVNHNKDNTLYALIDDKDGNVIPYVVKPGVNEAWHHICLAWDGKKGEGRIWLDGVEVGINAKSFKAEINQGKPLTDWYLGVGYYTTTGLIRYFEGWIDEVLFLNYMLDKQTILKMYNSGKGVDLQ